MLTFNEQRKLLKKEVSHHPILKVALLSDSATQLLADSIRAVCIEAGYNIELYEADYNQIDMQFMIESSDLHQFSPEFTIVFHSTQKLLSTYNKLSTTDQKTKLSEERLQLVQSICSLWGGTIIYLNYPELDDMVFGGYANKVEHSFIYQLRQLNVGLMRLASTTQNLFIGDLSTIQNSLGRGYCFQSSMYYNSDMVLSLDVIPLVAYRIFDVIAAVKGRLRKCLVLDLDNTLWGGVIGDDGVENIKIGGMGVGKAFEGFQYWIKKLKERGIILAVCSKNTEEVAMLPFKNHPAMVLKMEDISLFIANWENKADNIRHIRTVLNIGYDSIVFVDDNPVERDIVRKELSEVVVPEIPQDPANYVEYLSQLNLFETTSVSDNDKLRTQQYQQELQRTVLKRSVTNENEFLESLGMRATVERVTPFNIQRIAQLSQRSNQFNLRTLRYTESDLILLERDNSAMIIAISLTDRFGDNGLVAVVAARVIEQRSLFIENWFMSCRVLKRGLERFTLNYLLKMAQQHDILTIEGEYIPTPKNEIVKRHYLSLGFKEPIPNKFSLEVSDYQPFQNYISIK